MVGNEEDIVYIQITYKWYREDFEVRFDSLAYIPCKLEAPVGRDKRHELEAPGASFFGWTGASSSGCQTGPKQRGTGDTWQK